MSSYNKRPLHTKCVTVFQPRQNTTRRVLDELYNKLSSPPVGGDGPHPDGGFQRRHGGDGPGHGGGKGSGGGRSGGGGNRTGRGGNRPELRRRGGRRLHAR